MGRYFTATWHPLSQFGNLIEHIFRRGQSVPFQITADHGARATDPSPAMDKHRILVADRKINQLEDASHGPDRWHRSIRDGYPDAIDFDVPFPGQGLQV